MTLPAGARPAEWPTSAPPPRKAVVCQGCLPPHPAADRIGHSLRAANDLVVVAPAVSAGSTTDFGLGVLTARAAHDGWR